ncbi:hypothetical protein ABIF65_004133 [Bradyrhizobium japonicum]|jgi:hypothetical protein|uniref:hypothetical protein n=1 Tax=Bradyrhizobium TaxID=374 RepID=UPI0003F61DB2|nr:MULTISPECIES: hypothetical protein [Bradyrhizobium]MBR0882475.1 hypothetical protein [Bradyrhizobium liaoningense]MBR1002294.1 hypothetical protein [Bradyrhizobium liaoningense]MBR1068595.1 hypothetical protein [Bradyrhizobium liaoningense]MCP1740878.1 hypothetical protein [Bradyrhizobium japonicum]MCP1858547.1 hypothetical protein [Bradyrhizobium japonicum]
MAVLPSGNVMVINGPVIAAGESVSDAIDVTMGRIVRITMPADWLNAALTFQVSSDGAFFNDLFDSSGHEVTFIVQPGVGVVVLSENSVSFGFVKFRSGTRESPVPQPAQREFAVAVLDYRVPTIEAFSIPIKLVT